MARIIDDGTAFLKAYKQFIFPYCRFVDIYNIGLAYPNVDVKSYLQEILPDTIEKRLREIFKDEFNEFKTVMKSDGGVISGSFIMQCLLDEHWNSDIDIFIPQYKLTLSRESFPRDYLHIFLYISGERVVSKSCGKYDFMHLNYKIDRITDYKYGKYKIQIIQVKNADNRNDLIEFVNNTFDFDICKNVFYYDDSLKISPDIVDVQKKCVEDYIVDEYIIEEDTIKVEDIEEIMDEDDVEDCIVEEEVVDYDDYGPGICKITDFDELMRKKIVYKTAKHEGNTKARYKKYLARGFKESNGLGKVQK